MTVQGFAMAIETEMARAQKKHGPQWHLKDSYDDPVRTALDERRAKKRCDIDHRLGRLNHAVILAEEVAEAMTAAARGDTSELRQELIQVGAMCCKWIEALDRRVIG